MALFTGLAIAGVMTAGAAIATGAAVYGTVATVAATSKATKAAKASAEATRRASDTQVQMQKQQATRQRRSAIRQTLSQRSQLQSRALALNVAGSSGAAGGQSAISSQLGANLGFGSMMSGLGQRYTSLTGQAADFASTAQLYQAYAGIGQQVAGMGSFKGLTSMNFPSAGEQAFGSGGDYLSSAMAG